jgi:hypothetical protein
MFFYDWTMVLLIPAILLSLYAQWKVQSTFTKYSKVRNRRGVTGAQVAEAILRGYGTAAGVEPDKMATAQAGLAAVNVEATPGQLSDHYDPRGKVLRLSEPVYASDSIAAVSVAAHEAGHAMQDAVAYPYLGLRSVVVPVAQYGSKLTFPILLVGLFIPALFTPALNIAILLYIGIVAFTLITLPVEFNASRRALRVLEGGGFLATDEIPAARAVLNAAALTYVAATVSAVLMLLRLILLRNSR